MQPTSLRGLPEHIPRAPPPCTLPEPSGQQVESTEPSGGEESTDQLLPAPIDTPPNRFGIFRCYTHLPSHDPEEGLSVDDFTDIRTRIASHPSPSRRASHPLRPFGARVLDAVKKKYDNSIAPFLNITVFRLMHWLYSGSPLKSTAELNRLVHDVFLAEDYEREHITNFNADRENERLDGFAATTGAFAAEDGWKRGTVEIPMPKEGVSHASEEAAPRLSVSDVYFRPFLEVIKAAYQDPIAHRFHWFPYQLLRKLSTPDPELPRSPAPPPADASGSPTPPDIERIHTDLYNSDAMLKEHECIQEKARTDREEGDTADLEYAVAPILLYSDSTHLTSFGTAALWPIYLFIGNLSKYIRARPNAFAAHHLAYIPSVSCFLLEPRNLPLTRIAAPAHHSDRVRSCIWGACFRCSAAILQARSNAGNLAPPPG